MEGSGEAMDSDTERKAKAKEARLKAETEAEAKQLAEEQSAQAAVANAVSGSRERSESELQYEADEYERARRVEEGIIEEGEGIGEYDGPSELAPPKTARGGGSRGEGETPTSVPCATARHRKPLAPTPVRSNTSELRCGENDPFDSGGGTWFRSGPGPRRGGRGGTFDMVPSPCHPF